MRLINNYSRLFLLLILTVFTLSAVAQQGNYIQLLGQQNKWVDSVYNKLNRRQKIAQLFFVRAHTNKGIKYEDCEIIKVWKKK